MARPRFRTAPVTSPDTHLLLLPTSAPCVLGPTSLAAHASLFALSLPLATWRTARRLRSLSAPDPARPPGPSLTLLGCPAPHFRPPRPLVPQWCYDPFTCTQRMTSTISLVSSQIPNGGGSRWPSVLRMPGIFDYDPRRNPLAGANLVQIGYCSSDAWVGNSNPADNALNATLNAAGTYGWFFKGQRIIEATLAVLEQDFGLGSVPNSRLLFGGCSAGARGAMFNLDYVPDMVPDTVDVRGFFDSPLWVYVAPFLPSIIPLDAETKAVRHRRSRAGPARWDRRSRGCCPRGRMGPLLRPETRPPPRWAQALALYNASGRLGGQCAASNPGDNLWKCAALPRPRSPPAAAPRPGRSQSAQTAKLPQVPLRRVQAAVCPDAVPDEREPVRPLPTALQRGEHATVQRVSADVRKQLPDHREGGGDAEPGADQAGRVRGVLQASPAAG